MKSVRPAFFALSIDQYDGSLHDYRVMLTWQPKPWAGIGIGYNGLKVGLRKTAAVAPVRDPAYKLVVAADG